MRRGRGASPMTVVDKLDKSALHRGTETESCRRRRCPIWENLGRSSSSSPSFYLTWNRTWCNSDAVRDGQPRRGGHSVERAPEPKRGYALRINDGPGRRRAQRAVSVGEKAAPVSGPSHRRLWMPLARAGAPRLGRHSWATGISADAPSATVFRLPCLTSRCGVGCCRHPVRKPRSPMREM